MKVIKFDKDAIEIDCVIKMGFTYRAYGELSEAFGDPEAHIANLSKLSRLIFIPGKDNDDIFSLQTSFGIFTCSVNEMSQDGFSIISYKENNLYSQNDALRKGIIFSANNGLDVGVLLPDIDKHFRYLSGEKYDFNELDPGDTKPAVNIMIGAIREAANKAHRNDGQDEEGDSPVPSNETDYDEVILKELLKQSEQYTLLSFGLEKKKVQEQGNLPYKEFFATDYDRIDRIAYAFIVDEIDEKIFKPGVNVALEGRHQEKINGEIIEVDADDKENIKIIILFNTQVSIEMFAPFGWITLPVSKTNRDVQLAANKNIANSLAKARYMKNVLGGNRTSGFEDKDLSDVKEKLSKQKSNESQVTAITKGINTKDVFLVMGPPGTGKTTVILEWVKYFVKKEHKRVLVSSQNNKAVDNVLARLVEEKDIDVIRLGNEANLQREVIPYMFENKLVTLNREIDLSTRETIDRLQKAIDDWTEYRNSFKVFNKQLTVIEDRNKALKENIESQMIPIKVRMKKCFEEYREAYSQMTAADKKYAECMEAIDSYHNKNFILQGLLEERHQNNLKLKEQMEIELKDLRSRISDAVKKYNRYSEQYEIQKKTIKSIFIMDMESIMRSALKEVERFEAVMPEVPGIAGLFEDLRFEPEYVQSGVKLNMYLKRLVREIQRARKILDVTEGWREEAVGKQHYALKEVVLETVDLVGATCIGVGSQKKFSSLKFDVTIIDEAGQIQIHNALVPMSVSNKLIMLGDYNQIPPSADQELLDVCHLNGVDTELLEKSLFEKLFMSLPKTNTMMLDTQYRMPGEIADTISDWFYNGEYKSPEFKRNLKGLLPQISEKPFIIIDTSDVNDRYEKRTPDKGTYNLFEAEICKEIITYVIESSINISLNEIGIISAYKDQVARIKKAISKVVTTENANAMAATLDSFQGQERDLILFSFTKSSNINPEKQRIGFLKELRRLNVAMSRCKKTLIMIGDMDFLAGCLMQPEDEEGNIIYDHSEKEFSDFIMKMLTDVTEGSGELLKYAQFKERLEM